jgi:hypothetical protein
VRRTTSKPSESGFHFRDVAHERGLDFHWGHGGKTPLTALETFGCGCAFLDANEDGWLDVFLVGEPHCALYLNDGRGAFVDASARSRIDALDGDWKGCAIGDFTGDGKDDLILTGYHSIAALQGDGRGGFRDITRRTGLKETGWGSSAALMDLDADGDLDLLVGHYVIFGPKTQQYCSLGAGVRTGCPPSTYDPEFTHLYRNNGTGGFTDVTAGSGLEKTHGKALVFAFSDFDADGKVDFYIGNDGTPADLLHNRGGLRFENQAVTLGVAMGVYGQAQAAMGADWGDYDCDGRLDLVVTAFSDEPNSLYRNKGAFFDNVSTQCGIAETTNLPLGFGVKWLDLENDGWLDLIFANGHVYEGVEKTDPRKTYLQSMQVLHNREGQFTDVSNSCGPDVQKHILGRGLASGDFDRDGRLDLLIVDYEGEVRLLRNETAPSGQWLEVELAGEAGNRWAYGARVSVITDGHTLVQDLAPCSSYLSSSAPWLHFGLGNTSKIERIDVRWPEGRKTSYKVRTINRRVRLLPDGTVQSLEGNK